MANKRDSIDANVRHQLYIERLAATQANTLDPELQLLAVYIRHRLADEGGHISSQRALNAIVRDVRGVFGAAYEKWQNQTGKFFDDLAAYETGFQSDLLDAETVAAYTPKTPTQKSSKALVSSTPMTLESRGAVYLDDELGGFSKLHTKKVTDKLIAGFHDGAGTSDISAAITGNKKNGFKDGVMIAAKRSATRISKTGAYHVSTVTKSNVYEENERAVQGYSLVAVLDIKTSKQCMYWDGTEVKRGDTFRPRPPFHDHCRTVTRPLLREDLNKIKNEQRETHGAGEPEYKSTNTQYYTWLKQQPAWFQDEKLGAVEGKIFRNAGLTPQEFRAATATKMGTPLTIEQMAEKDKRIADYLRD